MFVSESEMQYDSLLQILGCDDSEEHIVICKEEMPVCISLCEKGFLEKGTPVILLNCVGGNIICMKALHGGTECFAEIKTVLNCTCFSREIQQMYSDGKAVEQYYQSQKQDTDFLENSSALCITGAFVSTGICAFLSLLYGCAFAETEQGMRLMQAAILILLPILLLIPAYFRIQNEIQNRNSIRQESTEVKEMQYQEMEKRALKILGMDEEKHTNHDCFSRQEMQLS